MKIRKGLVSNSSSSSFVLAVPELEFNKTMKELHPYEQAVVNAIAESQDILGTKAVVMTTFSDGNGYDWTDDLDIEAKQKDIDDYGKNIYSAWHSASSKFQEKNHWTLSLDW